LALDKAAIVIADKTGTIRFWSKGAETAFGYPAEDALNQTLDLIVPDEFREAHWLGFHRAMAAGSAATEGQDITLPVRTADGRIQHSAGKLTLLRKGNGGIVGVMVIFG
jgi:PAS domain S-box-containing protein